MKITQLGHDRVLPIRLHWLDRDQAWMFTNYERIVKDISYACEHHIDDFDKRSKFEGRQAFRKIEDCNYIVIAAAIERLEHNRVNIISINQNSDAQAYFGSGYGVIMWIGPRSDDSISKTLDWPIECFS